MKTWIFISLRKFRIAAFAMLFFWFSVTKQSLENVFFFPALIRNAHVTRYVTLARPLRLIILYFLMEILVRWSALYLHDSKWNLRSDVDGLNHTKYLLNLVCIVYNTGHWIALKYICALDGWLRMGLPPPPREFCRHILSCRELKAEYFKKCLHSVRWALVCKSL